MTNSKAGRPASYGSRLKRTSITLPVEYIELLKALGNGNISNAIRKLIEQIDAPVDKPQKATKSRERASKPVTFAVQNRPAYIYGLCDPGSSTIRYIGKTVNIKSRLAQHLYKAQTTTYKMNPCAVWIDELKLNGQRPDLIVLEETTEDEWEAKEQEWIKTLTEQGNELLNVSAGGLTGRWIKAYHRYDEPPVARKDDNENL